jgi:hypothetical protein
VTFVAALEGMGWTLFSGVGQAIFSLLQRNWDSPIIKGLVWFIDGSRMKEGTGAGVYGQSVGRRLIISL